MPSIDLPLEELRNYAPSIYPPADLDQYWSATLQAANAQPLGTILEAHELELRGVAISEVGFDGFEGGRIAGWYLRPEGEGTFPGVVVYHGYSGRGPRPLELYTLAAQGVAVLSFDCRGQNGESTDGVSRDGGYVAGWMTQGIRSPAEYYYRYVYADAVRAIEVLASFPEVDEQRIAVTGVSQGGGLALVAAALSDRPVFAWADVPFLCDFRRAVEVVDKKPYTEITDFLRAHPALEDDVWNTLSYIDLLNLADRVSCPVVVTAALWDDVCPPSTIFGVFRRIGSAKKTMRIMPYHRHETSYDVNAERLLALLEALGVQR
jgi:cephalosporin-C deacetylase